MPSTYPRQLGSALTLVIDICNRPIQIILPCTSTDDGVLKRVAIPSANDTFGDSGIVRTPPTFVSVLQRCSDENVLCHKATKKPPSRQRATETHNPSFIQTPQSLDIGFPLTRIAHQAHTNIVTGIENANLDPSSNVRESLCEGDDPRRSPISPPERKPLGQSREEEAAFPDAGIQVDVGVYPIR